MFEVQNKTVTILGARRSGFALAKLVQRLGGTPKLSDTATRERMDPECLSWVDHHQVPLELGGHTEDFIYAADVLVLSPGVSVASPLVQGARTKGLPVLGEIEFAAQFSKAPLVAVTGSNGKTTVSTLIARVLEAAGKKVRLCGNVGQPFSDYVGSATDPDYYVLEVSSFQMESLLPKNQHGPFRGFSPQVAVLLNFNENHLDRHKDLDDYFSAKVKIFQNQTAEDTAVLNEDQERCRALGKMLAAKIVFFSGREKNPNHEAVRAVARALGIPAKIPEAVFADFTGVEHRLEWVRTIDGIDFINDSKATTAEAGRWALQQIDRPVLMICGGRDKNIDFSVLRTLVGQKVKKIFAIGEARAKIQNTFGDVVPVESCEELGEAVFRAREEAAAGDCVVLTPMCASFDMFRDFEDRGRTFKNIVENLT